MRQQAGAPLRQDARSSRRDEILWRAAAALLVLALGACAGRTLPIASTSFAPSLGVDLSASTKDPSGLYYRDLHVGEGARVANGMLVSVRYIGWLVNGTPVDSTGNGPPVSFRINRGVVIQGWDKGVLGMRVGGRRQLIIPPALGYRARGSGPVPPDAILIFNIEVVSAR